MQRHVSVVHAVSWDGHASWVSLSTLPPHLCGPAAVLQLQMKLPASLLGPYIQPYAYGVWMGVAAAVCAAAAGPPPAPAPPSALPRRPPLPGRDHAVGGGQLRSRRRHRRQRPRRRLASSNGVFINDANQGPLYPPVVP
ncbi:hypothetical protein EMIHUDRAFT_436334 [Emiliania huxleyi CCMP1516]|uniref:Uncharacterized protein n=2 Tax=Emiliania huxleyi TaxID=2903 RepID=A0A0D3J2X8_EMIH1|nr:hypothetical protein EMIHUDRAFT_436334 [Emiliania huxleyi CCMP1516]EOD17863.1 hypothetical protein EMIHUDRAFT_436334 [Emiliania huxleyi CCMP1516]|eukprot:XP_005770292.1 hypothetical protein EMIHUDRAFT_436334 [Emiliania huxleyi CCMP1516]